MIENNFKVIIPVYNSEKWIQKCIWSLFNQSFEKWKCVIINDASTDKTLDQIKSFMSDIPQKDLQKKNRFRVLDRNKNVGALENIVYGINLICDNDEDIIVLLDGDDWLYSYDVLEYVNQMYNDPNIWLTYGKFKYKKSNIVSSNTQILDTRNYRKYYNFQTSHLRTFKYKIWKKIKDVDLRDKSGKYYSMAWDLAIMFPLIEMAGPRRIKCSEKILYIYNDDNPINDFKKNGSLQRLLDIEIRNKPQYQEII